MAKSISNLEEKNVAYRSINSYATLNALGPTTKNVWLVFHGMGYLSRYFLKPFTSLSPDENYFVAPQAPSKYYLNDQYNYVGASWLTKENTKQETENVLNYIDSVMAAERILESANLILFGFSQGVSIVMRWMASRQIQCKKLVLYAGGIPNELKKEDFSFVGFSTTEIHIIYGDKDQFLTPERIEVEREKIEKLFADKAILTTFEGGHEIKSELLKDLI